MDQSNDKCSHTQTGLSNEYIKVKTYTHTRGKFKDENLGFTMKNHSTLDQTHVDNNLNI